VIRRERDTHVAIPALETDRFHIFKPDNDLALHGNHSTRPDVGVSEIDPATVSPTQFDGWDYNFREIAPRGVVNTARR
jgi:hypothetical protein